MEKGSQRTQNEAILSSQGWAVARTNFVSGRGFGTNGRIVRPAQPPLGNTQIEFGWLKELYKTFTKNISEVAKMIWES